MNERNPSDRGAQREGTGSPAASSSRAGQVEKRQSGNGRHVDARIESPAQRQLESNTGSDQGSARRTDTADDPARVARFTGKSPVALMRQLMADAAVLVRKEAALAAAEINQSVDGLKAAIASMLSGGAILHAGILFLLAAVALALAQVMQLWLAVLIVGGIVTLIGIIMLQVGRKKLEPARLKPERTVDSLRKDKDALRRQTS